MRSITTLRALREQLQERDDYEDKIARRVVVDLRLHNDGAVPLEDARLVIELPGGLTAERGIEVPAELDEVPRFRSHLDFIVGIQPVEPFFPPDPYIVETGFRILAPSRADWTAGDVQHRNPVNSPPLVVAVEAPDTYQLAWQVHADNMTEPVHGVVELVVAAPDATSAETLSCLTDIGLPPEEDEDEYEGDDE